MVNIFNLIHPNKVYTEEEFSALMNSGLKKDAQAYKNFIETYDEKIKVIREFEQLWDSDTLKKTENRFKDIKELNDRIIKQLNTLTVDISRQSEITKSFLYKMLSKKMRAEGISELEDAPKANYYRELKSYIARINEDLKAILDLIKQQNKYIDKSEGWKTIKEIRQHGNFFRLIYDESLKTKEIAENIQNVFMYLKNIKENISYEDLEKKLLKVRFAIAYPYSHDLKKFYYGPYMDRFPDPGERESYEIINQRIKEERYFVILAKIDNEVVGGVLYTLLTYNNVTWVTIYWTCVLENMWYISFLKIVGPQLVKKVIDDANARVSFSGRELKGLFVEINDPEKMTKEQIENDAMDPKKRINFWQGQGLKRVFKGYVQLTSDENAYVYYCSLFVVPFSKDWSKGISRNDLYSMCLGNAILGCGFTEERLKIYKPWLDMMEELNKQEFYPLEGLIPT